MCLNYRELRREITSRKLSVVSQVSTVTELNAKGRPCLNTTVAAF